jgi:hypothetical protein
MVAELATKTIRVTPELRLTEVLEEANSSPVLLERDGNVYRLSKESVTTAPSASERPGAAMPAQSRDDGLAEFERIVLPGPREGESFRDFFMRTRAEEIARDEIDADPAVLTPEQEEEVAAIERVLQRAEKVRREHGLLDDSTEIIRRDREARSRHLAEL